MLIAFLSGLACFMLLPWTLTFIWKDCHESSNVFTEKSARNLKSSHYQFSNDIDNFPNDASDAARVLKHDVTVYDSGSYIF
jgi:hypothetical protein